MHWVLGCPGSSGHCQAPIKGARAVEVAVITEKVIVTICHPRPTHPRPRAAFAAALRAVALAAGATLKYSGNPVQVLLSTERPLTGAQRVAETLALEGTVLSNTNHYLAFL